MNGMKPLSRCLALAFGGSLVIASASVYAQEAAKQERIEVTGSSIKRIEAESALPVTVIKREDIARTGATTVTELLDKVSANNGGGYNLSLALGDAGRPGFSGASLRGLGSTNTLILLNGRRMAVYAFDGGGVNLNALPLEVVDRIEILRDGASAVYGSDAIAGVINVITRKDYQGLQMGAGASIPEAKGGRSYEGQMTFGWGDLAKDRVNVFGTIQYNKYDNLKASDRSFSKSAFIPSEGVNRLSSNAFPANFTNAAGALRNPYAPYYSLPAGSSTASPGTNAGFPANGSALGCSPPVSFGTWDGERRCRFDYASVIDIVPPSDRLSFFSKATFQINEDNQLFAEASISRNKYKFVISPTPASEATTKPDALTGATAQLLYPATGPYYPGTNGIPNPTGATGDLNLYYRTIDLGGRRNDTTATEGRFLVGATGTLVGWDYNTGLSHSESKASDSYISGYVAESKLIPAMYTGLINPFGYNTGAGLDLLKSTQVTGVVREAKSSRDTFDLRGSRELTQLPAGPLAMAAGVEYRREKFDDNPSPVLNTGDIIGGAGEQLPVKSSRNVSGVFGELSIPIVKSVEAQLAARFDKYSDFGNTTNPKLSLRWQPNPAFLLRGSAGSGFRAPTLPELFTQPSRTNSGGAYDDPLYSAQIGCGAADPASAKYCGAQLGVKNSGNTALKPEKSTQFNLGVVIEPSKNLSAEFNLFQIKQRDVIGLISGDTKIQDYIDNFDNATLTSTSVYSNDVFTRIDPVSGARVIDYALARFENLIDQVTRGVDFSIKYKLPKFEAGTFGLNWDGTYLISQKQTVNAPTGKTTVEVVDTFATFGPVLRLKYNATLTWEKGPWGGSLAYNWQSSYSDQNGGPGPLLFATPDRTVGIYETFDLQGKYDGIKGLALTAGIRNVLDRKPPFTNVNAYFQVGFDPTYSDPRGRTFYTSANYKFY
jgi:iron complex outermembrane recepter protein